MFLKMVRSLQPMGEIRKPFKIELSNDNCTITGYIYQLCYIIDCRLFLTKIYGLNKSVLA